MKTYTTPLQTIKFRHFGFLICLCLVPGITFKTDAQTSVCGPISSATWAPAGNPYIIACDTTVPYGQTLTIRPGVVVWLGSNVTLTVNGSIQAVGMPGTNPNSRIIFQSPPGSQYYWNR